MMGFFIRDNSKLAERVGLISPYGTSNHLAPTLPAEAVKALAGFFI